MLLPFWWRPFERWCVHDRTFTIDACFISNILTIDKQVPRCYGNLLPAKKSMLLDETNKNSSYMFRVAFPHFARRNFPQNRHCHNHRISPRHAWINAWNKICRQQRAAIKTCLIDTWNVGTTPVPGNVGRRLSATCQKAYFGSRSSRLSCQADSDCVSCLVAFLGKIER